ncbi:MAG: extracellular solute-binding protein [Atribacterota bacterium]
MERWKIAGVVFVGLLVFAISSVWAQQEVKLTFWTFVEKHADYMQLAVEEFNKANPDIKLVLEASTYPYEEMHDKLLMALASGVGAPDLADIEISKFGLFLRGDIQLHDLTDMVDEYRDKLVQERLSPYNYQGRQYGIDYHLGALVMYYNLELFQNAGINVDDITTWDAYVEAGKKITQPDKDIWMTVVETSDLWTIHPLMEQRGGGAYNAKGEMILDCQENIEALQFMQDLVHKYGIARVAPGSYVHDPSFYAFANEGRVASLWMPQWYMIRFTEFMPDLFGKVAIRPMPRVTPEGRRSGMGGGTGTAITKQIDPGKLDVAKRFLGLAKLTYEANKRIWTDLGFDPIRKDVYDDPELMKPLPYFNNEPVLAVIKDLFEHGDIKPEYLGPHYPEIREILRETVCYRVIEEKADPATVLKEAAEEIRALEKE